MDHLLKARQQQWLAMAEAVDLSMTQAAAISKMLRANAENLSEPSGETDDLIRGLAVSLRETADFLISTVAELS
jgi:hypothetical protein